MKASLDDPSIVEEFCARIAEGRGVREVCSDPDMPSEPTVYRRMAKDPEFLKVVSRAREAQQEAEPDRIVDMADAATAENWQVVKLRIWARQWRASKLAPKKYGEKIAAEVTGKDGEPLGGNPVDMAKALAFALRKGLERKRDKDRAQPVETPEE